MNAKTALAGAALFGSVASSVMGGAPADAGPIACASGYYTDTRGNCQQINGLVDGRCQSRFEAHPATNGNGYECVPTPPGY